MSKEPTIYLSLDTSSSNEFDNGDCDYSLIPLTPAYVNGLLQYRNLISFLYRADRTIYCLECWDPTPLYFRTNETFECLKDIHGQAVGDIPRGEPIILSSDPEMSDEDFQSIECQTVQVSHDELCWAAHVKHSNIRIGTTYINYKVLETIQRRFPTQGMRTRKRGLARVVKPEILGIKDEGNRPESGKEEKDV